MPPQPISSPFEESLNPQKLSVGLHKIPFSEREHWLSFAVTPRFFYSIIINTGNADHRFQTRGAPAVLHDGYTGEKFQGTGLGFPLPDHGIPRNASPARSGISFFADPKYESKQYMNYGRIRVFQDIPFAWVKIIQLSEKHFSPPFRGIWGAYNFPGHRTILNGTITKLGHDGIDLQPYSLTGNGGINLDVSREVVPIASGVVTRTAQFASIGGAVWIEHTIKGKKYTSLSMHLQKPLVTKGMNVIAGKTLLGFMNEREEHLHLELFPFSTTSWHQGYSNSSGGQIDPFSALFEL